jgi:alanine racemase
MTGLGTKPSIAISRSALLGNLQILREHTLPGTLMAPVVKANAWGHGRDLVARVLAPHVDLLAVATADDAIAVSRLTDTPVLCLGPAYGSDLRELLDAGVEVTVWNDTAISNLAAGDRVHLLVDTGLHRLGTAPGNAPALLDAIRSSGAEVAGVFCHVAGADRGDWQSVEAEVNALRMVAGGVTVHTGGSSLIIERPDLVGDIARPGIALYGFPAASRQTGLIALTPVLSLTAPIVDIRELPAGSRIGYAGLRLKRRTIVATLAVGVTHGVDPRLADAGGCVSIRGQSCAILTAPMLDYLLADITSVSGARLGDTAQVLGGPSEAPQSVSSVAHKLKSSPEHVLARLGDAIVRDLSP